jgi:creatinine amidohydrolase
MLIARPDLVHMDRATNESGADQARQKLREDVYTGIWWYTQFPNHYSGEGAAATKELGEYQMNWWIASIVKAIRAVNRRRQPQTAAGIPREEHAPAGYQQ